MCQSMAVGCFRLKDLRGTRGDLLTVKLATGAATDAAGNPSKATKWSVDVAAPVPALTALAAIILTGVLTALGEVTRRGHRS